ncbi:MAG TPA: SUMF1/EgtB/PvdO family nonheme iron enzyme [Bryobacteraceae bacterium]|nr:SUMF1/EgtB/PvdO family nonheme iron enzyme [Bryobacteraceae bacterium]
MTDAAPRHDGVRVFICHASEDKAAVRELCRRLRDAGFAPWLDEEELLPGQDWDERIHTAVRACDAVLVCLSRAAVTKAGYLQKEIGQALDAAEEQPEGATFLIPVKLEPCDIPRRLARWQSADLSQEGGFERLVETLRKRRLEIEGRSTAADTRPARPFARPTPGPRRRQAYWLAAGLLLAAAVGVYWYRRPAPRPNPPVARLPPPDMVAVPGGTFVMGRDRDGEPEEAPAHSTTVQPFWIDQLPVTNGQYLAFVRAANHRAPPTWSGTGLFPGRDNDPVTRVSWGDAEAFCEWKGQRLPTEAEWEFAARGSDGRIYPWGEDFRPAQVNSAESRLAHVLPVDAHPQNVSPFRVREMSGNVWEWCRDDFALYRGSAAQIAIPPGAKAIRGGSYESDRRHVTTAARNLERPATQSPTIGFRCAQ